MCRAKHVLLGLRVLPRTAVLERVLVSSVFMECQDSVQVV